MNIQGFVTQADQEKRVLRKHRNTGSLIRVNTTYNQPQQC